MLKLKEAAARTLGFATANILPEQLVWFFARRFIAGKDIRSAVQHAEALNREGFSVSIDYIGEECNDPYDILNAKTEYIKLINAMHANKVNGDISLKLSHFGLLQDTVLRKTRSVGRNAFRTIIQHAAWKEINVWIDAERLDWRDKTWHIATGYSPIHAGLGVCIQAYAPDAWEFLSEKIKSGWRGPVRVCKGAYREPRYELFVGHALEENFMELCWLSLENNFRLQIATNDDKLADKIYEVGKMAYGIKPYECAMLLGANPAGAKRLVDAGYRVKIYTPYGTDFKGYVARRIAERPQYVFLPFRKN